MLACAQKEPAQLDFAAARTCGGAAPLALGRAVPGRLGSAVGQQMDVDSAPVTTVMEARSSAFITCPGSHKLIGCRCYMYFVPISAHQIPAVEQGGRGGC
jgi:hypothetical protein